MPNWEIFNQPYKYIEHNNIHENSDKPVTIFLNNHTGSIEDEI